MFESFEEYLTSAGSEIQLFGFVANLILSAVLTMVLARVYVRYGDSLSNRDIFSRNFLLITMSTMLIITIVKSSLALSLGLVGALSIIRFRAAIKEPEELSYLFLAIGIGLGFGANQGSITIVAFIIILGIIVLSKSIRGKIEAKNNLHVTIATNGPSPGITSKVIDIMKQHCTMIKLVRLDEDENTTEVTFLAEFSDHNSLLGAKIDLQALNKNLKITFLDNKGLV